MNTLVFQVVAALLSAGTPVAVENPLCEELVKQGITMPDGTKVVLTLPAMKAGLTAQEQSQVITRVATLSKNSEETFLADNPGAPVAIKVRTIRKGDDFTVRTVDASFVVRGKWEVLTNKKFADKILQAKKADDAKEGQKDAQAVSKAGTLTDRELALRKLTVRPTENPKECFLYTTFGIMDLVEVSATRHVLVTETPDGVIVAAMIDPRFAKDKPYPNQWREIKKGALGNIEFGPSQPYSGAGFYVKVTRLTKPEDTLFVEYHCVYNEPHGWFDGQNTLSAQLPKMVQYKVKEFRTKLAKEQAKP